MTEAEEQAAREIRAAMKNGQAVRVIETVDDDSMPALEQKSHTLMLAGVDNVAIKWIAELKHIRDQTIALEAMVIAQCDRVKAEITKMHLLGVTTLREAQRTQEVNNSIAAELEALMDKQDA